MNNSFFFVDKLQDNGIQQSFDMQRLLNDMQDTQRPPGVVNQHHIEKTGRFQSCETFLPSFVNVKIREITLSSEYSIFYSKLSAKQTLFLLQTIFYVLKFYG